MIYVPKYFTIEEIFPRSIASRLPSEYLWSLMDEKILQAADAIREYVGRRMFVNYYGMQCRGFRDCNECANVGGKLSAHRVGKAIDFNIEDMPTEEVYEMVLRKSNLWKGVRRIENIEKTPTWIHIDSKEHNEENIKIF